MASKGFARASTPAYGCPCGSTLAETATSPSTGPPRVAYDSSEVDAAAPPDTENPPLHTVQSGASAPEYVKSSAATTSGLAAVTAPTVKSSSGWDAPL